LTEKREKKYVKIERVELTRNISFIQNDVSVCDVSFSLLLNLAKAYKLSYFIDL